MKSVLDLNWQHTVFTVDSEQLISVDQNHPELACGKQVLQKSNHFLIFILSFHHLDELLPNLDNSMISLIDIHEVTSCHYSTTWQRQQLQQRHWHHFDLTQDCLKRLRTKMKLTIQLVTDLLTLILPIAKDISRQPGSYPKKSIVELYFALEQAN